MTSSAALAHSNTRFSFSIACRLELQAIVHLQFYTARSYPFLRQLPIQRHCRGKTGRVSQKALGEETEKAAGAIRIYEPDRTWKMAE
jgi:hypothetical protein